jgi:hypothetical protein
VCELFDSERIEGVLLQGSGACEHDDGWSIAKAHEVAGEGARSWNRLRKLYTERPSAVRLQAVLLCAAGETLAAATGDFFGLSGTRSRGRGRRR